MRDLSTVRRGTANTSSGSPSKPGINALLITHRHHDHVGAIPKLYKRTKVPTRARLGEHCRDAPPLRDREVIEAAGLKITVLFTPGIPGTR